MPFRRAYALPAGGSTAYLVVAVPSVGPARPRCRLRSRRSSGELVDELQQHLQEPEKPLGFISRLEINLVRRLVPDLPDLVDPAASATRDVALVGPALALDSRRGPYRGPRLRRGSPAAAPESEKPTDTGGFFRWAILGSKTRPAVDRQRLQGLTLV